MVVQVKGWQRSFHPSIKASIAVMRSLAEVKLPWRMACRVMMPKKNSHHVQPRPDVGVKCSVIRGLPWPT